MAPVNARKWTEVQLQAMVAPDLGKWITVAAPIRDMDAGHLLLDASDDWSPFRNIVLISVPLSPEQGRTFGSLAKGTAITVVGKIEVISSGVIYLTEYSIVDAAGTGSN
jgi:hypothetical protein